MLVGEEEVIKDTLTCLRFIACREDTERYMEQQLLKEVYNAWEKARRDIYEEWFFAADPANLQPRVRPLFGE